MKEVVMNDGTVKTVTDKHARRLVYYKEAEIKEDESSDASEKAEAERLKAEEKEAARLQKEEEKRIAAEKKAAEKEEKAVLKNKADKTVKETK